MKKKKLTINELKVTSFLTSTNQVKGGVPSFAQTIKIFCATGASCPECGYTVFEGCDDTFPDTIP